MTRSIFVAKAPIYFHQRPLQLCALGGAVKEGVCAVIIPHMSEKETVR